MKYGKKLNFYFVLFVILEGLTTQYLFVNVMKYELPFCGIMQMY